MSESSGSTVQSSRLPKEPLIVAALILIVSVTIAVGGIVYKTKDSLQRDKVEFLADANQKQVAPLRRVIQLRLAQDKARLIQFAATRSALGPGRSRVFGDFALVSLLTPGAGGQWGLSWIEKGPLYPLLAGGSSNGQAALATLTANQEVALLKSLPYDRIREGDIYWQRLSDSSGRPIWSLAVSVETQARPTATGGHPGSASLPEGTDYQSVQVGTGGRAVVVGFFGHNPLLSATEDFIGSTSTAFVIDSRGYAATHSNKTMVGSLLKDDPAVKEVFSARSSAGATRYQSQEGPRIFSAFEQVDRSNLYVVMSTPETIAASSGQGFGRTAVTTGLLALVVGLFMIFAWGARLLPRVVAFTPSQSPQSLAAGSEPMTGSYGVMPSAEYGRPNSPRGGVPSVRVVSLELPEEYKRDPLKHASNISSAVLPVATESEKDRAAFVRRFVTGLERGMKEPLLAAMAHVQLVKVKAGDAPSQETMREISDHVMSVDRDLRRAKEMIDELAQLASQAGAPTAEERADLNRIITSTVDQSRSDLTGDGIILKVETSSVPLIRGREEPIRKVLLELLKNSRRALKGRSGKSVTVRVVDAGDNVKVTIKDNGVGMDRDSRAQAFEPFFHGFDDSEARGLGLAMVRSVVFSHGGTVEIDSAPGDGTAIVMQFPILASERTAFQKQPVKVESASEDGLMGSSLSPSHDLSRTIDFGREGGVALGGKVPLSEDSANGLPPSPRFGADDDDKWTFGDTGTTKPELGSPAVVADAGAVTNADTGADVEGNEKASSIKIRPVRRG